MFLTKQKKNKNILAKTPLWISSKKAQIRGVIRGR